MLGDGFDIPADAGGQFDRIIVTAAMEQIPEALHAAAGAGRHPDRAGRAASGYPDPGPRDQDRGRLRAQGAGRRALRAGAAGHRPRTVKSRIGCPANILFAGLSGCLLGRCLLKTVFCCVRVSNHVPCRRVALLAPRTAGRGAGADVDRFCRLQRRHVDAAVAEFLLQSLCTPSRKPPVRCRRPRSSAASFRNIPGRRAQYQSAALPPPIAAPQSYPAGGSGVSGGGRGVGSYSPPTHQPLETTGTVAPRSVAATRGRCQGGTTIIVGTSDTLEILSRRYNVSSAAIMQANGYKGPRALSPGQQLIIPHPTATAAAAPPCSPRRRASRLRPSPRRRAFMSSITAIRCSASPAATMCRSPNSRKANNLDPSAKLSSA